MRVVVFEDAGSARLGPPAQTRPVYDLRCGALTLLGRQMRALAVERAGCIVRPEVADVARMTAPWLAVNERSWLRRGPLVLVNARWLPGLSERVDIEQPGVGLIEDQVAWVVLPEGLDSEATPQALARHLCQGQANLTRRQTGGVMIDWPWDLIDHNARALEDDFFFWRTRRESASLHGPLRGPADRLLLDPSARVEPLALVDTTNGPVIIDARATVQAFSRIEGPCYIGPGTQVLAGHVKGSSIGPQCRIGGEVEESIVHGHSNKAHDGFLGHSYLGEWVNFGAGTQTSDLRNDYAKVSVILAGQKVQTGLLKVGSFVGDHTKTSIGTLLNTGSVIGPFTQLVASGGLMPRSLPAFCQVSQGRISERNDLASMFATASTMMGRRGLTWTEAHADFFFDLYEQTAGERRQAMKDSEQRRLRRA